MQKAFALEKPTLDGKFVPISKVRMRNGLSCEISEGNWKFSVDMPEGIGGNNTSPTPNSMEDSEFMPYALAT